MSRESGSHDGQIVPRSSAETVAQTIIQDSPVFKQTILDVLPRIINNLDPCSFVRFARTCKKMNSFCFNTKKIQIPCWDLSNHAYISVAGYSPDDFEIYINSQFLPYRGLVPKMAKMPFVYNFESLNLMYVQVNDELLMNVRNFLSKFPCTSIHRIDMSYAEHYEGIVDIMKDYGVKSLYGRFDEAPLEILSYFTQNLDELIYDDDMPDDMILRAKPKIFCLLYANITRHTFKKLIKKYAAGEIEWWLLQREEPAMDAPDPFLAAVEETEMIKCVKGNLIMPPTGVSPFFAEQEFHIVKSDGSPGIFKVCPWYAEFGVKP